MAPPRASRPATPSRPDTPATPATLHTIEMAKLTLGDIEDIEELTGRTAAEVEALFASGSVPIKVLRALVYVAMRGADPTLTFEGARKFRLSDFTISAEPVDPTNAAG